MYKQRKDTNINKHKFFHPTTGRNQDKLDKLEAGQEIDTRAIAEREKVIAKEKAEIAYLEILDPTEAKKQSMKFMYEDLGPKIEETQKEQQMAKSVNIAPDVNVLGGFRPDDAEHKAFLAESKVRQLKADAGRKAKEDPMAAFGKLQHAVQKQTLLDPAFQRALEARKKSVLADPGPARIGSFSAAPPLPAKVPEKRPRHDSDDEK